MKSVLGLLLLLFAASTYGLESVCDATQDASVCYGALGGPVVLELMKDTTGYSLFFSNEKGDTVFIISGGRVRTFSQFPQGRWQVVVGIGTLIINPAERSDSGTYTVMIFREGRVSGRHTVQLVVEAPVSDLDLSISCSANGERRVSCSSNGDGPEYSWSLYGRALSGADADLSADNQTVLLKGNVIGQLTCTVSNHVSTANITKLTRCPGLESVCDVTQDASVCYGALGGPVMLQLVRNTTGYELFFWNERDENGYPGFSIGEGRVWPSPGFPQGRWQVVAGNGTLIINPAERSDSGTYTVDTLFPLKLVGNHTEYQFSLVIEAPVSDLDLSIVCLANGMKIIRCSSNGDSPLYSWSLDGRALSGADADLSADNQTVLLKGNVIGQLTCTVSNHVSTANITKP